jgi:hypothetical protein
MAMAWQILKIKICKYLGNRWLHTALKMVPLVLEFHYIDRNDTNQIRSLWMILKCLTKISAAI